MERGIERVEHALLVSHPFSKNRPDGGEILGEGFREFLIDGKRSINRTLAS